MGIFREFWKTKLAKAQIISEAAWIAAVVLALHLRSEAALGILSIIGVGFGLILCYEICTGETK
jgi:hypothetical protein